MALAFTTLLLISERLVLALGVLRLREQFAVAWIAAAGVAALWALRGVLRQSIVKEIREQLTMLIAEAAFERCARGEFLPGEDADAAVFEGRSAAELVIVRYLPPLAAEPVAATVLLIALRPPWVPAVAALIALTLAGLAVVSTRKATEASQRNAWRRYLGVARETLTSIRAAPEIVASGYEHKHLELLRKAVRDWTEESARAERKSALVQRIPIVAIAIVGVALWSSTPAFPLEAAIRLSIFLPPISGLLRALFEVVRIGPRIQTLGPPLDARFTLLTTPMAKAPPPSMPCEIRFEAVTFAYGNDPILKNISFAWKPGDVLRIKGANGAGKSTLLKLILGLVEPSEGKILAGGIDLKEIDLSAWRRKIAYLPQRPFVPEKATVFEMMRMTQPTLTKDRAKQNLLLMNMGEPTQQRKDSSSRCLLQTPMASLSVGERQRVLLARTFMDDAVVGLFDEPDENLDFEGRASMIQKLTHHHSNRRQLAIVTHDDGLFSNVAVALTLELQGNGRAFATKPH